MDSLILPFVRLQADDNHGFVPEMVSVREFRALQYDFCAWTLAQAWLDGKLAYVDVALPELDDKKVSLRALTLLSSADDFADAAHMLCYGRKHSHVSHLQIAFGYDIAPVGLTETFGAYCPSTAGWLNIHPYGPALVTRRGADVDEHIDKWLDSWARTLDFKKPWPVAMEHTDLLIPIQFAALRSAVRRKRKSRPNVRRFIGLSN